MFEPRRFWELNLNLLTRFFEWQPMNFQTVLLDLEEGEGREKKIKISSYRVYRALWRESQVSMVTLLQAAWQKQKNMWHNLTDSMSQTDNYGGCGWFGSTQLNDFRSIDDWSSKTWFIFCREKQVSLSVLLAFLSPLKTAYRSCSLVWDMLQLCVSLCLNSKC